MIIEGNLLIGILIVVALAIGALVVYIRFAVKKEPSDAEPLFSRLLSFGRKDEEDDAQDESSSPATDGADGLGGLSLPVPAMAGGKADGEEPAKKASFSLGMGGIFSGVLGSRKNKDEINDEVRAIDEQLNSVLQDTEEINVSGLPPQISADDLSFSDGKGMRELDLEMGTLQGPLEIITPEELKPPAIDLSPAAPAAAAPPKLDEPVTAEQKKPDAPQAPVEAEASRAPADFMADDKKGGAGDDLLADLEASAKQVETVDMSIMKEYQDMPITCGELESDLKGILDQITINGQGRGDSGH